MTGQDGTKVKGFINKTLLHSLYYHFLECFHPTLKLSSWNHTVPLPSGFPGGLPSHLHGCWLCASCLLFVQPQSRGCPAQCGASAAPLLDFQQPPYGAVSRNWPCSPLQVPSNLHHTSAVTQMERKPTQSVTRTHMKVLTYTKHQDYKSTLYISQPSGLMPVEI